AMTGHQPHVGTDCASEGATSLDIVRAVRGLGVDDVEVVDPNDLKRSIAALEGAYRRQGVRVVVTRHACPLFERRLDRRLAQLPPYAVDHSRCKFCGTHDSHTPCGVPTLADDEIRRARTKLENWSVSPGEQPTGREVKPKTAPCSWTCPANICVFGYLGLARVGRYREALALIRESVPLPKALGRVCHRPCETTCVRADYDAPIAINQVKRFVAERETPEEYAAWIAALKEKIEPNGRSIAVIGGGPAGLTAAYELRLAGYTVDLHDREQRAGGMLALCLPNYRMPQALLRDEVNGLLELGIRFRGGEALGRDFTVRDLLERGHDAVCLAVGAWRGLRMGVEGEDAEGVEDALRFLRSVNVEGRRAIGRRVMIVGGGDAAMDAARTALRLGAEAVEIVYRRSAEEMPADEEELAEALDEGVTLTYLTAPTRFVVDAGRVVAAECVKNQLGAPDASGRRRPVPVPGSEFTVPVDTVILAIGQEVEPGLLEDDVALERGPRGEVRVDPATGRTSHERVFAAGDVVTGPATVIDAIAQGRKAARGIERLVRGEDRVAPLVLHTAAELDPCARYHPGDVTAAERARPAVLPAAGRTGHFEPVSLGLDEAQVRAEAERCLSCGQCARCNNCIDNFGCPAIYQKDGKVYIDPVLCVGCGICAQLCPNDAIHPVEEGAGV
ncbi:MAG: FAD-dependent oxidoreductase, partial [Planctomycetes bacterium]|nr:FAD-dependent oxidoreductase [Planctomycetota bacterium]